MSKILYEWRCSECDHEFEALAKSVVKQVQCPMCEATANRVIITPPRIDRLRMGAQKHASPESIDYFEKVHKSQKAIEERHEREHGDYGPAPGA